MTIAIIIANMESVCSCFGKTDFRTRVSKPPSSPTEYCISVFVFGRADIVAMGNRTVLSSSLVPLHRKVLVS